MSPDDAVTLLAGWLERPLARNVSSEMIAVLAHIDSNAVNGALEQVADNVQRRDESQNALFWLAMRRGEEGRAIVMEHLQPQWPLEHRSHAVTALGLSKHPEALEAVRAVARTAEHEKLRAAAVTALGMVKAPGAMADLHSILLSDDSDTVREQAIFWLSQLKGPEVAAILADIARDPRYGKHRKTALFWLTHMSPKDSGDVLDELMGM
jgi:HEAT repeat protein